MHSGPPPSFVDQKSMAVSKRQCLPSRVGKEKKKKINDCRQELHSTFKVGVKQRRVDNRRTKKKKKQEELQLSKQAPRSAHWKAIQKFRVKISHDKNIINISHVWYSRPRTTADSAVSSWSSALEAVVKLRCSDAKGCTEECPDNADRLKVPQQVGACGKGLQFIH